MPGLPPRPPPSAVYPNALLAIPGLAGFGEETFPYPPGSPPPPPPTVIVYGVLAETETLV